MINMINTIKSAALFLASSCIPLLTSCDRDGVGSEVGFGGNGELIAKPLDVILLNDRIFYLAAPSTQAAIDAGALDTVATNPTLAGNGESNKLSTEGADDILYSYSKSVDNDYQFLIEISKADSKSPTVRIEEAKKLLLGENSDLNNPFRQLLIIDRDGVPLNAEEIARLADILNLTIGETLISGADPTKLLVVKDRRYVHTVTSTAADQRLGTMGGLYTLEVITQPLEIRVATEDEAAQFNGIVAGKSLLLFLEPDTPDLSIGIIEQGPWSMKLENTGAGRF